MIERFERTDWLVEPPPPPLLRDRIRRWPWQVWGVAVLLIAAWACLALVFAKAGVAGLFVCMFTGTAALYNAVKYARAGRDIRDLMDIPPVVPQYPVEVTYSTSSVVFGRDQGVVYIVDGILQFQGRRSRFAFVRSQLYNAAPYADGRKCLYDLTFLHEGKAYVASMSCYNSVPGVGSGYQPQFQVATEGFVTAKHEAPPPAVLPPLAPSPEFRRSIWKSGPVLSTALLVSIGTIILSFRLEFSATQIWLMFAGLMGTVLSALLFRVRKLETRVLAEMRGSEVAQSPSKDLADAGQDLNLESRTR
jgi:hypothetical protein